MKLPADAVIAKPKVANDLLQWQPGNDKSQFLAPAVPRATRAAAGAIIDRVDNHGVHDQ